MKGTEERSHKRKARHTLQQGVIQSRCQLKVQQQLSSKISMV